MGDTSTLLFCIVMVLPFAVINVVPCGRCGVLQQTCQQIDFLSLFAVQLMTESIGQTADAECSHGVDEQRVRTVKGIDVAAVRQRRPARGLNGSTYFQGKFVKPQLSIIARNTTLQHKTAKLAVGRDIVKPVVVYASIREVRSHIAERVVESDS